MAEPIVVARLNDRAQPMHRGELYEDPLNEILQKQKIGEVVGGGTQLNDNSEIDYCEIEIQILGSLESALATIATALEELGAPKGSKLILEENTPERPFGKNEGMGVYLNGTDLPEEVYETSDINFVISELSRLLEGEGMLHSYWEGPEETALYLYGPSFEKMRALISDFVDTYPLCQNARVVQIA
jgi:hypothetical protein